MIIRLIIIFEFHHLQLIFCGKRICQIRERATILSIVIAVALMNMLVKKELPLLHSTTDNKKLWLLLQGAAFILPWLLLRIIRCQISLLAQQGLG